MQTTPIGIGPHGDTLTGGAMATGLGRTTTAGATTTGGAFGIKAARGGTCKGDTTADSETGWAIITLCADRTGG